MKKWIFILIAFCTLLIPQIVVAQTLRDEQGNILDEYGNPVNASKNIFGRDTTETKKHRVVPTDRYMWHINENLGYIIPAEMDSAHHRFQNSILTGGNTGQYNHLGNLGSPRISRIFMERDPMTQFLFTDPFDYWFTKPDEFFFTNTKSPFTNISY